MNRVSTPWNEINAFLLDCGNIRDPKEFCTYLMKRLNSFIAYDQARIYFLNDNRKVYDEVLFGVNKRWTKMYFEYYANVGGGRYSPFGRSMRNGKICNLTKAEDRVRDWTNCSNDEFIKDYLRPQGIQYSTGFMLHDIYNSPKATFIIDRLTNVKFSDYELNILNILLPHLENLFKNFYVPIPKDFNLENVNKNIALLTAREREIAKLLMQGASTNSIGDKLCISTATVYKHISHIHEKLNVSSQQELLIKLMSGNKLGRDDVTVCAVLENEHVN
ncbi:MAG: hypothetical protein PWP51_66 [Clostridiales bacterium]|jgi:DNA-binding CsgD family transcriptional regulator|nr:hypothetical protein [Clostridiales bacterium]MDN5297513.1 hypothetical protein [Clostridiales bacterium]